MSAWVDVKLRLPEENVPVLCCDNMYLNVWSAQYQREPDGSLFWWDGVDWSRNAPDFWMKLPPPPPEIL